MRTLVESNDLSQLKKEERFNYYRHLCISLGLNPLTQPLSYMWLKAPGGKKLVLYANKNCADQLRKRDNISTEIVQQGEENGLYVVHVRAKTPDGRTFDDVGATPLEKEDGQWVDGRFESTGKWIPLRGEARSNAIMKAVTKGSRRVTLSMAGHAIIDESEVDSIMGAVPVDNDLKPLKPEPGKPADDKPKLAPDEISQWAKAHGAAASAAGSLDEVKAYYNASILRDGKWPEKLRSADKKYLADLAVELKAEWASKANAAVDEHNQTGPDDDGPPPVDFD